MTPMTIAQIREAYDLIRRHSHPMVHEVLDTLERRLMLDEGMLAVQARLDDMAAEVAFGGDADVIPFPGHSVKVV